MSTKTKTVVSKLEQNRKELAKQTTPESTEAIAAKDMKPLETTPEKAQEKTVSILRFPDCKFNLESLQRRIDAYHANAGRVKSVVMEFARKEQEHGQGRSSIQYDGSTSPLLDSALIGRMVKSQALPVQDPAKFLKECRAVVGLVKACKELLG